MFLSKDSAASGNPRRGLCLITALSAALLAAALALSGCDTGGGTYTPPVDPLTKWQAVAAVPFSNEVYAVAYGNGRFVAGGSDGTGAYSFDGAVWASLDGTATTFGTDAISSIKFLNGKFWAVGGNGKIAASTTGISWDAVTQTEITGRIRDIAYGAGKYVAVGEAGMMVYSSDGAAWTANDQTGIFKHSGNTAVNINSIVYAAGKFVAVGQSGTAAVSGDGVYWINVGPGENVGTHALFGNTNSGSNGIKMVAYGNGIFVAAGQAKVAKSADGIIWTKVDLQSLLGIPGNTSWLNCVTFVDGRFVAGGGSGQAVYSVNGQNWTKIAQTGPIFGTGQFINSIAYGVERFVAVGGGSNRIAYTVP
ncbi:MAG: hypothetical protein LBQ55_05065 [Treponema sp.]|nr:hypothetical protein [Treponema sp.]